MRGGGERRREPADAGAGDGATGPGSFLGGALLVAAVAVAVHAGAVGNGFAYDDVPLVLGNPAVRDFPGVGAVLGSPYWPGSGGELAIWRPLTTLSLAADWWAAGADPAWYHAVNVALHAGAALLVALLLAALFPPAGALAGGLLFAVHPVHVEAVANAAGRGELLAAVFLLGAVLLWHRGAPGGDGGRTTATATALLFLLALLSKESAVVLPGLLLLVDGAAGRWRLRREAAASYLRSRGPALLLLGAVAAGWLAVRGAVVGGLAPEIVNPVAEVVAGPGERIRTALQAWPVYLRLLLFPRILLADYGPRVLLPAGGWTPGALAGLLLLAGVVAGGAGAALRGRKGAALALLWFPVAILPVSNLVIPVGVLVAERTLYVPSVALSMGVAAAVPLLAVRPRWLRGVAGGAFGLVLALLAARSAVRVPEWSSTGRIFRAQLRDRPDSYRAHWYLARVAREEGREEEARAGYARALELWPHRRRLVLEAAAFAVSTGRLGRARTLARHAVRSWPDRVEGWRFLAAISLDLGDTATARRALAEGLRIDGSDDVLRRMRPVLEPDSGAREPDDR